MDLRSAAEEEAIIRWIAGEYITVEDVERKRYWYRISGTLKPLSGLTASAISDMPPQRVRKYLLIQTENLLAALSKSGWQLADGTVDISFRTDISGSLMTLAGAVTDAGAGSTTAHISILIMREISFD